MSNTTSPRLVALDLDGTLLVSQSHISPRTRQAIEEAVARGIVVLTATGRPQSTHPPVVAQLTGVRYAITSNGAAVWDLGTDPMSAVYSRYCNAAEHHTTEPVSLIARPMPVELALYCIPYLVVGWDVLRKALKGIKNRQPFDECFLMAVATVGAFALGDYVEGCAVIIFYQIGELFQSVAVGKSRQSISSLMDIRPDYANIEDADGKLEQVDPDDVEVGTVIVVQPGERVPIDGVIVEGTSALNTAALTGESLPRDVQTGDEVISGCVNMTGLLKVRTTKEFGESTVSKILDLVENSSMKKARTENFITRFARVYTPAVCYSALALAFIPPVILLLMGQPARFGDWVYRAMTFLVIS